MTNMDSKVEFIRKFRDAAIDAVKFAMVDETTESISQALGSLMVKYTTAWIEVPYSLVGCIDKIYAESLLNLGKLARDEVLVDAIDVEYKHIEKRMEERAKERASASETVMVKPRVNLGDIMEAS